MKLPKQAKGLVTVVDPQKSALECAICGQKWFINASGRGNKLPRGWWKCSHGCTQQALEAQTVNV